MLQSALLTFIFFVTLGTRKSTTNSTKPAARPKKANQGQPTLYTYAIKAEFPHDAGAFTQGLEYHENCEQNGPCKQVFFESTGLRGKSTVREVELLTGKVLRSRSLPKSDFGEGITKLDDTLYQLTWQSGKAWSYKADDFDKTPREFKVKTERNLLLFLSLLCSRFAYKTLYPTHLNIYLIVYLYKEHLSISLFTDSIKRRVGHYLQQHPPLCWRLFRYSLRFRPWYHANRTGITNYGRAYTCEMGE